MREKLAQALSFISDGHIAEAAGAKKKRLPYWIGAAAAILALVLLLNSSGLPLAMQAKAVSVADYPKYDHDNVLDAYYALDGQLSDFFRTSVPLCLSGAEKENQTYSPVNLYMALALAAELTGGQTQTQIVNALGAGSPGALRALSNAVWNVCYRDKNDKTLLANSVWLDKGQSYNQAVMDRLASDYYASVYQGELGSQKTDRAITAWLNGQTGGLLKKETSGVHIDPAGDPVLMVYSTIFYRAKWQMGHEFSARRNTRDTFHAPDGDITCTYMHHTKDPMQYYWCDDAGAVSLWLRDGSRMWLILPDKGKTPDDLIASGAFTEMIWPTVSPEEGEETSRYVFVNLSLPKFDIRAHSDLRQAAEQLGITDAFSAEAADFSPSVTGPGPVFLTGVNQATRVAIDEEGVTAASYIELPGAGAAAPPDDTIDFVLDRPFLFVITNLWDIPLFAGVVNQPE